MFKHIGTQLMLAGARLSAGPAFNLEALQRQLEAAKARSSFEKRTATERKTTFHVANGQRERERRMRQGAHERQLASHRDVFRWNDFPRSLDGTQFRSVKPAHIFGRDA